MPAEAGIQKRSLLADWIPAFAGMTVIELETPRLLSYLQNQLTTGK